MPHIDRKSNGKYLVQWVDENGKHCTATAPTKEDARALAAEMDSRTFRAKHGIIDRDGAALAAAERVALAQHIEDWDQGVRDKGGTREHQERYRRLVREALLDGCGFQRISDLDAVPVQRWIASKGGEWSAATGNHAVKAVRAFSRWLQLHGRSSRHRLALVKLRNVGDGEHPRGVLLPDEFEKVVRAAEAGPVRYGLSADDRGMLYRLKMCTGFRTTHLAKLTPESFVLDAAAPHVVRRGTGDNKAKHRKPHPIAPELAELLRPWLAGRPAARPVFDLPKWRLPNVVRMWRADLKAAGVAEFNAAGEQRTFAALRHTGISLVVAAAGYKAGQEFAGHSTPKLTLQTYTHLLPGDHAKVLAALPVVPRIGAAQALHSSGKSSPDVSSAVQVEGGGSDGENVQISPANQQKRPVSGASVEVGRAGIEPATHGFSVHCSTS